MRVSIHGKRAAKLIYASRLAINYVMPPSSHRHMSGRVYTQKVPVSKRFLEIVGRRGLEDAEERKMD